MPPRAHDVEEALNIGDDRGRHVAGQHLLRNAASPAASSSFRKKARASSSRTRTSSGRFTRIARKAAMASSSFSSPGLPVRRGVGDMGGVEGVHAGAEAQGDERPQSRC